MSEREDWRDDERRAAHRVLRKSTDELARFGDQRRKLKLYKDGVIKEQPEPLDEALVRETARTIDQAHAALFGSEKNE